MCKRLYWRKRNELMQQIMRLGVPTEISKAELIDARGHDKICIEVLGGTPEVSLFDLDPSFTGFIIWLSLTVRQEPFAIAEFCLKVPWPIRKIKWLHGSPEDPMYQFPGRQGDQFPSFSVINHRADATRLLRRGTVIEGFLLGYGSDPIPPEFRHGDLVPGNVGIVDQFGVQHFVEVEFWMDRISKLASASRVGAPRKSLFSERVYGERLRQ